MILLFFEPGNLFWPVVIMSLMFVVGPALLLTIIGLVIRKNNKKAAKVLFIIAAVYFVIGAGFCGTMLS